MRGGNLITRKHRSHIPFLRTAQRILCKCCGAAMVAIVGTFLAIAIYLLSNPFRRKLICSAFPTRCKVLVSSCKISNAE
jgi:hypothetical protein